MRTVFFWDIFESIKQNIVPGVHGFKPAGLEFDIRLNSIGAVPARVKRASVINAAAATTWNLRDAVSTAVVASGALSAAAADADTGQSVKTADFSAYATVAATIWRFPAWACRPVSASPRTPSTIRSSCR